MNSEIIRPNGLKPLTQEDDTSEFIEIGQPSADLQAIAIQVGPWNEIVSQSQMATSYLYPSHNILSFQYCSVM